ncbi:hypothetical protein XENOCAPTIV_022666 [Xenoophorus captivus]|uniref:PDZ domain-containing protein n=1 Tax=Xenoophorus captivus TaxID=1517983 RepID=A0ABV0RLI0_9TELE
MGNGLTIMADEEYLTISSTLEPPHSLPSNSTPTTNIEAPNFQNKNSFPSPNPTLHVPSTSNITPLNFSSDTPTTCPLSYPSVPLTTQPPKTKHHLIQQGLLPGHFKAASKNIRATVPPPQPLPVTPITAQIIPSVPPCAGVPTPTLPSTVLTCSAQIQSQLREEPERKERDYKDDFDEELDEEEEESRRKARKISLIFSYRRIVFLICQVVIGMIKEFELTVVLTKSRSGSFGFTITRSKLDNCYYIQEILDNPAKADGRLRAGDRLITVNIKTPICTLFLGVRCVLLLFCHFLQVNGHYVTSVADDVAMTILRSSPRRLNMTLGRAVSNLVAPPPCDSLPDIVLHKTPSGQLGIKLTGGVGSKWQGIYCLEVVPGSPASEEGSVKPNDKILYICGRCTLGMTLEDAVKACEIAPRKVKLKIIRYVFILG